MQPSVLDAVEAVDIATAARTLGISTQAVHKRIRRGSITATKRDGRWLVVLPAGLDASKTVETFDGVDTPENPAMTRQNVQLDASKTLPSDTAEPASKLLLEHLQGEVTFLRQELAHRDEELRRERDLRAEELLRKDQIIAALTNRLPAIPATAGQTSDMQSSSPSSASSPPTPAEAPHRPWWAFWRRASPAPLL